MKLWPLTGNSSGENSTHARYRFQMKATKVKGRDHLPKLHGERWNFLGVKNVRPNAMSAYAVIVGTPAAETREVKATGEGRIVHSSNAATVCMTMIAFVGSFFSDTFEIQPENGRTPSLATAQIRRELATPAIVVLKIRPRMQMTFMKT